MDTGNNYERIFNHIDYLLDSSIEDLQKIIDEYSPNQMIQQNDTKNINSEHVDADTKSGSINADTKSESVDVNDITKVKHKRKRCNVDTCNKKLKSIEHITNKCKCQLVFCYEHKMPESHNCQFNYIEHGRNTIKNKNPVVINDKIDKI